MNSKKRDSVSPESRNEAAVAFKELQERTKRADEVKRRANRGKLSLIRSGLYRPDTEGLPSPSVQIFTQGIKTHRPCKGFKPPNSGGLRDVITGWSSASRRRMREYMLTHCAPDGWATIGPSFTVPGPPLTHRQSSELWADFCRLVQKAGMGMIWRVEIQKRGVLHWHALLIGPQESHPHSVGLLWHECLRALGPCEHDVTIKGKPLHYCADTRMGLPGADVHACVIPDNDARAGAWLRYLQDHATKAKQEQIPESIGRHWGVVGRKRFVEHEPIIKVDLTDRQYAKALRAFQRLWTPSRPNPAAPFGRSLSYTPTRGRRGHCVAYTNPVTAARICEWARSDSR
jgi:hypothetical protein